MATRRGMRSAMPWVAMGMPPRPVTRKSLQGGAGSGGRLTFGVAAMQGWRDSMEDAHLALPDFDPQRGNALFGVFDGHGGAAVAEIVAERLPAMLRRLPSYQAGHYEEALTQTFLHLDEYLTSPSGRQEVCRRGNGEGPDGMGTTSVVALVRDGELIIANAGDSRCVLASGEKAVDMSRDHTPKLPDELARVKKAGGYVTREGRINDNLNLSRALGDLFYKKNRKLQPGEQLISGVPEVRRHSLSKDDRHLVFGCDGIWERASSQQVMTFLHKRLPGKEASQNDLTHACAAFLDENVSKHPIRTNGLGCDNMTLMMIDLLCGEKDQPAQTCLGRNSRASQRPTSASGASDALVPRHVPKRRSSQVWFARSQRRHFTLSKISIAKTLLKIARPSVATARSCA